MAAHQHQKFLATGLLLLAVTMAPSDDLILDADSEDNYTLEPGDQAMVVEPGASSWRSSLPHIKTMHHL